MRVSRSGSFVASIMLLAHSRLIKIFRTGFDQFHDWLWQWKLKKKKKTIGWVLFFKLHWILWVGWKRKNAPTEFIVLRDKVVTEGSYSEPGVGDWPRISQCTHAHLMRYFNLRSGRWRPTYNNHCILNWHPRQFGMDRTFSHTQLVWL